jgi:tetratricopeptide (TPR) repeat protein
MAFMGPTDLDDFNRLPLPIRAAIDSICTGFEAAWQAGHRPPLEAYLERHSGPGRPVLLGELLRLEVDYRRRQGESPAATDYLTRFAELSEVVGAVFALGPTVYVHPPADTPLPAAAETLIALAPSPLPSIPGYELVEELGRGGMGVVLRARDRELDRDLAVKVLLERHEGRRDLEWRFREEARLMGHLQHPGVPPVMEVGALADGRPFFAMKLVQGKTLAGQLAKRSSPAEDLPHYLAVFEQVCQALAYAHSQGVIHRDLKPSNVMVGAFGEVQVMDWGLAKRLSEARPSGSEGEERSLTVTAPTATQHTQAGSVLGTPAYMAPEQARGDLKQVDQRSDVFGLGAILCEILTGQPPYAEPLQARLGHLEPAYLRLEASTAEAELISLARTCLAADPAGRPGDAGVVARAVAAYQQSVQQRLHQAVVDRERAQVKVAEERKRRRLTVGLALAVLALVAGISFAGLWYQQEQGRQAREQAARDAEQAQQQALLQGEVNGALGEMDGHRQRATALTDDLPAWRAALVQARSALQRAEALLRQPELASEDLRQRVEEAARALAADERDWRLIQRCEQVRLEASELDLADRFAKPLPVAAMGKPELPREKTGVAMAKKLRNGQLIGSLFKERAAYPRLKEALASYGLTIGQMPTQQAVRQIAARPAPVQGKVLAILLLVGVERAQEGDVSQAELQKERRWLREVLGQADRDSWRSQVLQALFGRDQVTLARLAGQAKADRQTASWLEVMAADLPDRPALLLLRRALQRHSSDFWINYTLAMRLYRGVSSVHTGVGEATASERAALDEAAGHAWAALAVRPQTTIVWVYLGNILKQKGDIDRALTAYERAIELEPRLAMAHSNLGVALRAKGDLAGAIAAHRRAIELEPTLAEPHGHLAAALFAKGDLAGAITVSRRAIELEPRLAWAHYNLGAALQQKRDVTGAIAAYRRAIELAPRYAQAHFNLGLLLQVKGDVTGAITAYRRGIEVEPRYFPAHTNLGWLLRFKGDLDGAIAAHRRAVELAPQAPWAHCGLGDALLFNGQFDQAAAATQRCLDLLPAGHPLRPSARQQLQQCQALAAHDRRLAAVLSGQSPCRDANEALELAQLCAGPKRYFATAIRFFRDAFSAQPVLAGDLAGGHRYKAACCAARAGCGQGLDANSLDERDRARLRAQALLWLRADLASWATLAGKSAPAAREEAHRTLANWQQDADLARVRDPEALRNLPLAERQDWQKLWSDVTEQLRQVRGTP